MFKVLLKFVSQNHYVFIGILIGLFLNSFLTPEESLECSSKEKIRHLLNKNEKLSSPNDLTIKTPVLKKPVNATEKKSKLIRPRYYSTELGMREKLFVGIFTSEEKVNSQALHLNNTIAHLVDKIKYFFTAQYKLKSKFDLTGLVGFTDTRHKFRPFQVIKYIGDNFGLNYDYYFLANDYTFINAHKLNDIVKRISVSMDVYLGNKVEDSSFCSLDSGILLSNSVLKSMKEHLDWCVLNTISDDHSENIGRCVFHSIGLTCTEFIQNQKLPTFKLKHFELNRHLLELSKRQDFQNSATVYPVLQSDDFYLLNSFFLKERLESIKDKIDELSEDLTENWPPAQKIAANPASRHDVPKCSYFNTTHMFFSDDFTNVRKLTELELQDVDNIIEEIKSKVHYSYGQNYLYRRLINGYRKFDLSRGMEYFLDVGFRDTNTGKEVVKRFEIFKPLGKVEIYQVPYVTENTRVTILLPIQENEVQYAAEFLNEYATAIMNRKEKTFLMLVFLYQYDTPNKGKDDVFTDLKDTALKLSQKYKNDDYKIAWVSIRLPKSDGKLLLEENEALNFAVVDLALKKIGLESLMLVLDVYCMFSGDFLNRVRMHTIPNFQIFSPIPFRQYDPKISDYYTLDVSKGNGHYDRESYKFIAFYGKDYIIARKKYQNFMPIIKVDEDIVNILTDQFKTNGNIFEMFVKTLDNVHCMRASEFALKIKHHEVKEAGKCNLFLGSKEQLAKLLLTKESVVLR